MTTTAMKSANSVKSTAEILECAQNVSPTISSCTLDSVSFKDDVSQDKSWSTTIVKTSAQLVEITTELQESALTVLQLIMNFTTDFVSQLKPVESENGPMKMANAMKSTQNATLSTHQPANAQAASKDTTT